MSHVVLGIIAGVILTLFCMFCLDAWAKDNLPSDSELDAWENWQEELERQKENRRKNR